MIFRNLTSRTEANEADMRDWTFGHGKQDFLTGQKAIAMAIETALLIFRGEVIWDANFGVDWWNLVGSRGIEEVKSDMISQCRAVILNVPGVTAITSIDANVDNRRIVIHYTVQTQYSTITNYTII